VDPRLGPEKGTDGGELVDIESRQLEGVDVKDATASDINCGGVGGRNGYPLEDQCSGWRALDV
jgi:hypothetical protein